METAPCRHCGFAAERNYCAECGAPLYDYAEHGRAIFFPRALVEEVRADRFGLPELLGFVRV